MELGRGLAISKAGAARLGIAGRCGNTGHSG